MSGTTDTPAPDHDDRGKKEVAIAAIEHFIGVVRYNQEGNIATARVRSTHRRDKPGNGTSVLHLQLERCSIGRLQLRSLSLRTTGGGPIRPVTGFRVEAEAAVPA